MWRMYYGLCAYSAEFAQKAVNNQLRCILLGLEAACSPTRGAARLSIPALLLVPFMRRISVCGMAHERAVLAQNHVNQSSPSGNQRRCLPSI